jgi:predicted transcriptional regulator
MSKHFNTRGKSFRSIGNELNRVFIYLQKHTATASMVAIALNIYRPNVCRHKRKLEKVGLLAESKKGICKITKHRAAYLTTDPDLFPIQSQLNLSK